MLGLEKFYLVSFLCKTYSYGKKVEKLEIRKVELFTPVHQAALDLRQEVLGTVHDFELEEKLTVFVALEEGKVIGTAAVQLYPLGIARVRQVATSVEARGKSVGTKLMDACEDYALMMGEHQVVLTGRQTASGFYNKRGYEQFLLPFSNHGIEFLWMRKYLLAETEAEIA